MSETPVFTELRRTFEWTCPECGSDHFNVGEVDGQILTCEGCSQRVLVRWPGLSADGVVAEEPEWEYGWHTGSTVSLIGRRDQVEEWLAVRGWKLGEGDWGSRVMQRRVAGPWVPVMQES